MKRILSIIVGLALFAGIASAESLKYRKFNTDSVVEGTNKYYTDALARAALSSSATGLTYNNTTGDFSLTSGYVIPTTTTDLAIKSLQIGLEGTDGILTLYSDQGATDYVARLKPNAAMTSDSEFYLPVDEPASTFPVTMTSGGVMGYNDQAVATTSSPTFVNQILSGLTASAAIYSNGTKQLTSMPLTNGQLMIGSTGANPVAATITGVANETDVTVGAGSITVGIVNPLTTAKGGTGLATVTEYAVLCGGTTTTGALQSIASVGTANQVLTSNGASALPTFQNPRTLTAAPADHSYSGTVVSLTAGEALAIGDLVYFKSDGKAWKAKGDATSTMICMGLATAAADAEAAVVILLEGYFQDASRYNFTVGGQASAAAGLIYVSAATAGLETQTRPATATNIVQIIGYAITADIIYFKPDYTYVEVQ